MFSTFLPRQLICRHQIIKRKIRALNSRGLLTPGEAGQKAYETRVARTSQGNSDNKSAPSKSTKGGMETFLSHAGLHHNNHGNNTEDTNLNQPLCPPLDFATTYERPPDSDYGPNGLVYGRHSNPTRKILEETMSRLESWDGSAHESATLEPKAVTTSYSSGMAAIGSILLALEAPLTILYPDDVYHGVPTLLHDVLSERNGIEKYRVDFTNLQEVEDSIMKASQTHKEHQNLVVWMESPSNPLCRVTDIQAICDLVNNLKPSVKQRMTTVVDSTWAPPCIQQPLLVSSVQPCFVISNSNFLSSWELMS